MSMCFTHTKSISRPDTHLLHPPFEGDLAFFVKMNLLEGLVKNQGLSSSSSTLMLCVVSLALGVVLPLTGGKAVKTMLSSGQLSLVLFTSARCRKCLVFAPRFERLAKEATSKVGEVITPAAFYSVNVLRALDIYQSEQVDTLPTVNFYLGRRKLLSCPVSADTQSSLEEVRTSLDQLQRLPASKLVELADCRCSVATSADGGNAGVEWFLGTLATGGALLRLAAALTEVGVVAEVAPAVQVIEDLAECVAECGLYPP